MRQRHQRPVRDLPDDRVPAVRERLRRRRTRWAAAAPWRPPPTGRRCGPRRRSPPWDLTKNWSGNRLPTLIVGAEDDTIAPVASHSIPFFDSLDAASEKSYVELAGATHFAPNSPNTTIARYAISGLKEFVDNDDRYEQFLCGAGTRGHGGRLPHDLPAHELTRRDR